MKLAHWHRARGDTVHFSKRIERDMLEPDYDQVYGSAIFQRSAPLVGAFKDQFPGAVIGGTWDIFLRPALKHLTVEDHLGVGGDYEQFDYSIYGGFQASIGFSQRGCRLKCGHCCVPKKEGAPRPVSGVMGIWRGDPYPRHLHLLDNDFFGQPREAWERFIQECIDGEFRVCMNQGINIRMITDETAKAWAAVPYYDDQFKTRRLYTAWDNIGDEGRFFRGVETLERHGVPPRHLMVYMLIGYDRRETWARIFDRFNKMTALGIRPYPMPYNEIRSKTLPLGGCNQNIAHRTLGEFQRWVIRKAYNFIPFEDYDVNAKGRRDASRQSAMAFA